MATTQEKFNLILRACKTATEIESRGGIMHEHQPEIQLVISSSEDGEMQTGIQLVFSSGKTADAVNWSGMGSSLDESFNTNILCLFYELRERQARIAQVLSELEPLVLASYPEVNKSATHQTQGASDSSKQEHVKTCGTCTELGWPKEKCPTCHDW